MKSAQHKIDTTDGSQFGRLTNESTTAKNTRRETTMSAHFNKERSSSVMCVHYQNTTNTTRRRPMARGRSHARHVTEDRGEELAGKNVSGGKKKHPCWRRLPSYLPTRGYPRTTSEASHHRDTEGTEIYMQGVSTLCSRCLCGAFRVSGSSTTIAKILKGNSDNLKYFFCVGFHWMCSPAVGRHRNSQKNLCGFEQKGFFFICTPGTGVPPRGPACHHGDRRATNCSAAPSLRT
jgi:hypothetical protein